MFDDLQELAGMMRAMDHDVLMMVDACKDHAAHFSDEELVARLQNIDPDIEVETKVETAMAVFFQTGELGEYRQVMEDAYVLYFAELGYDDQGDICAVQREKK